MTTPELDSPSPAGAAGARGPSLPLPPAPRPVPPPAGVPWRDDGHRPARSLRRWAGWGRGGALVVALYAAAWVCDAGVRSFAEGADPLASLGDGAPSARWDLGFWVARHTAGDELWRRALAACGERDGAAFPNCATVRLASWWGPALPPPPLAVELGGGWPVTAPGAAAAPRFTPDAPGREQTVPAPTPPRAPALSPAPGAAAVAGVRR
jgi:hypothetical protein